MTTLIVESKSKLFFSFHDNDKLKMQFVIFVYTNVIDVNCTE